jgi:hypothetical protein
LKCLDYKAAVQLGDGSWERIGRLVRSRYSGTVMSVDPDGRLVPRPVTGWHATPLGGRSVYRLTYRSAKNAGPSRSGHQPHRRSPGLTARGYVPAEELRDGDRVATGQGLTAVARDVLYGSLLGDASISAKAAHVTIAHSGRQADYAQFKAELLSELTTTVTALSVAAVAGGPPSYDAVHVRSRAHRVLSVVRREFYDGAKRVPRRLASELNPRMLAFWFMDDGHTRIRPPRQPLAEIATNAFDDTDLQVLIRGLQRWDSPRRPAGAVCTSTSPRRAACQSSSRRTCLRRCGTSCIRRSKRRCRSTLGGSSVERLKSCTTRRRSRTSHITPGPTARSSASTSRRTTTS